MRVDSSSSLGLRLVRYRSCRFLESILLGKSGSKDCPINRKILIVEDVPRKIPCIFYGHCLLWLSESLKKLHL
jgi:hypothetical protein